LLVVIIIVNFGGLLVTEKISDTQQGLVAHTHRVLANSNSLLGNLRDAETGQRGFLLTDQASYLEPYEIGTQEARAILQLLKEQTADNPVQQDRLTIVQNLMAKKFIELAHTIRLAENGRRDESLAIVKRGRGKQVMDEIRTLMAVFHQEEERLLQERKLKLEQNHQIINLLYISELVLLVALVGFIASRVQKTLVNPIAELTRYTRNMASGQQSKDIHIVGNDEIGELAEAYNTMRRQVVERTRELKNQSHLDQAFSHAVTACTSSQDMVTALSNVMMVHALHHPSPIGAIYLLDEESGTLNILVSHGVSDDVPQSVPATSGLIGQAFIDDEPVVVDAKVAMGFSIDVGVAKLEPRAVVLQPISYSGHKLGILVLVYTQHPGTRDLQYIGNLVDQFAMTIVNARNSQQLKYEIGVKNRFFSIISHDLKSPFTALLGFTKLMANTPEKLGTEKLVAYAGSVNEAAEQVYELMHNLLEWSRLQMEGNEVEPEVFSLRGAAEDTITVLKPLAKAKNIHLNCMIEVQKAYADREMVMTVIRNLIANAIKFSSDGGTVEVSSHLSDGAVVVSVSDSGVGMSKKHADKVFALDQKTSTIGTAGEHGTGLGLPLCKDLLERNGGSIWLESAPTKGTQVHFSLPIAN
ncbi:MAG: CHASE3 domain-containing protein, partial [Magnetovibrio sp.]|nr:CHASE3 domain-containing protein [Magnetovibrio sp.]